MVSMLAIGYIADHLGQHTTLLAVLIVLTFLIRLSIQYFSSLAAVASFVLASELCGNRIGSIIGRHGPLSLTRLR